MKWIKPSGVEIETNDEKATIAYAESMGWKEAKKPVKRAAKAKPKAEEE